ncbi:MAG TPA: 50S ribosomal protein L18a [Ignisphaera sp.]|uniref:Large ribosomal subunit protein eL20 n=1 Tax=Ignisphaera aggregans TaxID=334771 RepID=A0A832YYK9_9CREN|nr:50S ribosomal protein L18a [Ignisphaera sp.]HIP57523.1 50S ribosomal protein L18a [Ignisphaera aggregans]
MSEIKVFRIYGYMLIGHDSVPEWRKFVKEIRALKLEHALEKLYSELGSKHKVKRAHIKILKVEEIPPDQAIDRYVRDLSSLTKMVIE